MFNMNFHSKILFQPSFDENLEVVLTGEYITLELIPQLISVVHLESKEKLSAQEFKELKEYRNQNIRSEKRRWKETHDLTSKESNIILPLIKDLVINKEVDDRIILDGIRVDCEFNNDLISEDFNFHSPDSSMRSYEFANQIIDLCFQKFESSKALEAIELVERYFGFHFPWKIVNTDPFTCRFYGRLSIHDQEELNQFIESIANQDRILIDLSNFEGMGTILYDSFRKLNSNIPNINWLVQEENDWVIQQLLEIGIDQNEIIKKRA